MAKVTFYERIEDATTYPEKHAAVGIGARRLLSNRHHAAAAYDQMEPMRDRARLIRAHTLSHLDYYLGQFINNVEALGGHVFIAKDAAEANEYVVKVARENGVKTAVKSKSMVTEEIHLNDALEKANVRPIESDLGEFIIQLAGERPSHIIAPVMHRTRQDVGHIFAEKLNVPYTDDPAELNAIARRNLRQAFLTADMGISGVNFAVADSGTISIVTNEGNARMSTTAPRIHVALMGMERIVPSFEELGIMLQILARSATGQKLSVYTTMITGPRRSGEDDGPEQFHVVIVDNGRMQTLGSELAEILYCIRCGACLNSCPVYQAIGGHAYGSIYPGPIGSVLTPALDGVGPWGELAHASTLCGACKEVCPVRIDIPKLLLKVRQQGHRSGMTPAWLNFGIKSYRAAAQRPKLYKTGMNLASRMTQMVGRDGWIDKLPLQLKAWTEHRAFPTMAKRPFREVWQEHQRKKK